ncbi:hypothetical protein L208DRAFT_1380193 [Tricholoma matsutake]|nr:hypothetical protein L208DRAFT_1380193 [Tricholoma matsutake 945]
MDELVEDVPVGDEEVDDNNEGWGMESGKSSHPIHHHWMHHLIHLNAEHSLSTENAVERLIHVVQILATHVERLENVLVHGLHAGNLRDSSSFQQLNSPAFAKSFPNTTATPKHAMKRLASSLPPKWANENCLQSSSVFDCVPIADRI